MLAVVMAVLYTLALLVVARLVRSGRLSGRGATYAMVGLAPAFGLVYVLLSGGPPLIVLIVALAGLVSALPLYRTFSDLVHEQSALVRRK